MFKNIYNKDLEKSDLMILFINLLNICRLNIIMVLAILSLTLICNGFQISVMAATTYYVSVSSGNDDNDGSVVAPLKTIQKACNIVTAGDTVIVLPGVYYENIHLSRTGTAANPITFKTDSIANKRVIITGADKNIRQKVTKWTLEDSSLGLYSVPLTYDPARITYDDVDLQPYGSLNGLKTFVLNPASGALYLKGSSHGFFYDSIAKKLYVRLHQSGKYGSTDPNNHIMAVAGAVAGGAKGGDFNGNTSNYIWGITPSGGGKAYVVLDGFTFEGPGLTAVYLKGSNITVRNSWFTCCRSAVSGSGSASYASDNIVLEYNDYTTFPAFEDAMEIIDMYYNDSLVTANQFYWWQRKGQESGATLPTRYDYETGGLFLKAGDNWIIRNNRVSSGFDGIAWTAMTTYSGSNSPDRGPQNMEINNNIFDRMVDNGIELENRCNNVRVHDNEFIDNYMAFSWQPMNGIPWPTNIKFYKNLVYSSATVNQRWLDKANYASAWFKTGAKKEQWDWWPWMQGVPLSPITPDEGGVLVFNNTIVTPYAYFGERCNGDATMVFSNFTLKNNIFVTHTKPLGTSSKASGPPVETPIYPYSGLGFDFHHNMYAPSAAQSGFTGSEIAKNGGIDLNNPANVGFNNISSYNFNLIAGSPARGAGVLIAGEPASSQDMGAIPYGVNYIAPKTGPQIPISEYLTSSDTNVIINQTTKKISYYHYTKDATNYTTLSVLMSKLSSAEGTTFQIYQSDGTTVATAMDCTNKVIVSDNGIPVATYTFVATIKYGDVSGDGNITLSDLTILKRYLQNTVANPFTKLFGITSGDVNKSNTLTISDLTILKRYLLNPMANPISVPTDFVYDPLLK